MAISIEQLQQDITRLLAMVLPPNLLEETMAGTSPKFPHVLRFINTHGTVMLTEEIPQDNTLKVVEIIIQDEKYLNAVFAVGPGEDPLDHTSGMFLYQLDNYNAFIGHIAQFFIRGQMPLANFQSQSGSVH